MSPERPCQLAGRIALKAGHRERPQPFAAERRSGFTRKRAGFHSPWLRQRSHVLAAFSPREKARNLNASGDRFHVVALVGKAKLLLYRVALSTTRDGSTVIFRGHRGASEAASASGSRRVRQTRR